MESINQSAVLLLLFVPDTQCTMQANAVCLYGIRNTQARMAWISEGSIDPFDLVFLPFHFTTILMVFSTDEIAEK